MVKVIPPSVEIMTPIDTNAVMQHLELCIRNCYKSEDKIEPGSAEKMIQKIVELKHEAMLEHFNITVKFVTDRGVTHEMVRHRMASYAQESTRYCNYTKGKFGGEITVIDPPALTPGTPEYDVWFKCMQDIESAYMKMSEMGYKADICRMVLPNSLKTEIIMTANLREWRHVFKLRTAKAAHITIRHLMTDLLKQLQAKLPIIFGDIVAEE